MKEDTGLLITQPRSLLACIELPLYAKEENSADGDVEVYWHRVEANMRRTSICVTTYNTEDRSSAAFEIEVEHNHQLVDGLIEHLLDNDDHACTAAEFNSALVDAIKFTQSLIGDHINE